MIKTTAISKHDPIITFDFNIPAKLIVDGHVYDVILENVTSERSIYDFGRDNYWNDADKKIVHGEEVITDTFVCKRCISKLY